MKTRLKHMGYHNYQVDVDYIERMDSNYKTILGMSSLTEEGYVASVEPTVVHKSDYFIR